MKNVAQIFSDYQTESIIKEAKVNALNVSKKDNSLNIILQSEAYLEIKDIFYLEKFLKNRFQFSNINTKVKYDENVVLKPIDTEWENIVCYIAHRYPLAKKMLIKKSDIEINDNVINVKVHIPGVDFLKARKADMQIQNTIENLFGKKYDVDLIEDVSDEDILKLKEKSEKAEKRVMVRLMEEAAINKQEMENQDKEIETMQAIEESNIQPEPKETIEEETPLILGRNANIRETLVTIDELGVDDGRVSIAGDVFNVDSREVRSRKNIINF